jgi:hypothetical protein
LLVCPEGHPSSGLHKAAPWGALRRPEGLAAAPFQSHGLTRSPARSEDHACIQAEPSASRRSLQRSEDLIRFQQEPSVRSSVGSVRKPHSPRFVAAGLAPKTARSEDLSFFGSIAVDLVRRLPRSEEQAGSRAGSIASADPRSGPEGLLL